MPDNITRKEYRTLSEEEKATIETMKDQGEAFIATCKEVGPRREAALAITKMEEAVMWATKAVTA